MRRQRHDHVSPGSATVVASLLALAFAAVIPVFAMDRPTDPQLAQNQSDLVVGLDGAAYPAYRPSVVEHVQVELKQLDLYTGTIDGQLDRPTKEAIARFQKEHGVITTGIPTPRTREELSEATVAS